MTPTIGFVAVIRPLFKGDSPTAAIRSLEQLSSLGERLGFRVISPSLPGEQVHQASGAWLPRFAVHDIESARQAARWASDEQPDLLLIQHTTFATGDLLAPLLASQLPAGLWALPESSGRPGRGGPLPLNSLCGLNMTLSSLGHPEVDRDLPVKWFYGEADSPWFEQRLQPTLIALRSLSALRGARILDIGGTAPGFYGLEESPALDGVVVERLPLAQLFAEVAAVTSGEAAALAAEWSDQEPTAVSGEQLSRAAAVEIALARLAQRGGHAAVAMRCWPELPERCGTMACAAAGRLGDRRLPAACEGDVMGALSMLALQGAADEPSFLMDLSDVSEDRLLFWHCGNAPRSWAAATTRLSRHFNREELGVVREMTVRQGDATGFRLLAGGRGAVIFEGTFAGEGPQGFDGVSGWLEEVSWDGQSLSARTFVANVLDNGLPHHFAFGQGRLGEGLRELCGWLGAQVLPAKAERHTL